jgi:methyltransferase family protein
MLQRLRRLPLTARSPAPEVPFDEKYRARHQEFVSAMLDDGAMIARFAAGEPLPPEYGLGLDERCIEYPWLFAQQPEGELLDAGSTLNHAFVLDRLLPMVGGLHIVTLAYEGLASPERGISYVYEDMRRLPYRDGVFDTVASLSTLEHVGMDNSRYGGDGRGVDPAEERRRAVRELCRVTARRTPVLDRAVRALRGSRMDRAVRPGTRRRARGGPQRRGRNGLRVRPGRLAGEQPRRGCHGAFR